MAVQSNLKNMALCLSLVCLVCSALLGGVYAVTAEPIAQTNANLLKASIQAVLPQGGELSEAKTVEVDGTTYEYYESVADGVPVAYAVKSVTSGFGGALTLIIRLSCRTPRRPDWVPNAPRTRASWLSGRASILRRRSCR